LFLYFQELRKDTASVKEVIESLQLEMCTRFALLWNAQHEKYDGLFLCSTLIDVVTIATLSPEETNKAIELLLKMVIITFGNLSARQGQRKYF
jgi:hypothetical protein